MPTDLTAIPTAPDGRTLQYGDKPAMDLRACIIDVLINGHPEGFTEAPDGLRVKPADSTLVMKRTLLMVKVRDAGDTIDLDVEDKELIGKCIASSKEPWAGIAITLAIEGLLPDEGDEPAEDNTE
jgi:hypothetical protein